MKKKVHPLEFFNDINKAKRLKRLPKAQNGIPGLGKGKVPSQDSSKYTLGPNILKGPTADSLSAAMDAYISNPDSLNQAKLQQIMKQMESETINNMKKVGDMPQGEITNFSSK